MPAVETPRVVIMDGSQESTRMFNSPNSIHRRVLCAGLTAAALLASTGCRQVRHSSAHGFRLPSPCTAGHRIPNTGYSVHTDADVQKPLQPPATTPDSYDANQTAPDNANETATEKRELTPEEVMLTFREAGGKLSPNADGLILEIDLAFSRINDEQFGEILAFPELRELDLTGADLHDESMQSLVSLQSLQSLKLKGTKITDSGLEALSQISTLVLLDASSTAVSDAGLAAAGNWKQLRYLSLNNTGVSDAGIMNLQSLTSLKGLSLINTAVTADGVSSLKKLLPDCLIVAQTDREVTRGDGFDSLPTIPEIGPMNSDTVGVASAAQLNQVIRLASQQPHLAVHLSSIYSSRGQWLESVSILESAAVADHDDPTLQFCLGEALARTGDTEAAHEQFTLSVGEAAASYNVGLIVYEDMLEECQDHFTAALHSDPSLEAAQAKLFDIQRELAELRQRQSAFSISESNQDALEVIPAKPIRQATQTRIRPDR